MIELTCRNHTGAIYYTKRMLGRNLHFIRADEAYVREALTDLYHVQGKDPAEITDHKVRVYAECPVPMFECKCPASDLVEVVTCGHCDTRVYEVGLVLPFNLDGTPHMNCFDKRFVVRSA